MGIRRRRRVRPAGGLRLGYGITPPGTARRMRPLSTINNVNGIVVQAGMAALNDEKAVKDFVTSEEPHDLGAPGLAPGDPDMPRSVFVEHLAH